VFVTGYTVFPYFQVNTLRIEPGHVMTVAYDTATGARQWIARHNESGVGRDFTTSIGIAPDGQRIFLGAAFKTSGVDVPGGVNQTMTYNYDLGVVAYNT
jgi:hypothetical protein